MPTDPLLVQYDVVLEREVLQRDAAERTGRLETRTSTAAAS